MNLSPKLQGNLLMLFVMCLFGINIPINKYLYAEGFISPYGMTALRMSFAAIMFWLVSLFMPKEKVAKKDLTILFVGGLLGMFFNQSLFAYGLNETSPVDASIITTSSPLFAMIIAAIVLKEPITLKKAGGVLLGGAGAIFLIYSSHQISVGQGDTLKGDLAILCAQIFYSTYIVITRPLSTRYSSITMMKWMFLFATLFALPLFGKDVVDAPLIQYRESIVPFVAISFTLVGATFLTYMLIPVAQRRIRPTTISMYNNVQPIIASLVAIYIGQDNFTIEKVIAAVLIFGGVYFVTTSKSREDILQGEKK